LFVPFSFLTYRHAFLGWLGTTFLCLLVCFRMLRRRLWRLNAVWRWLPISFFLGFPPVTVALMQGQDALITLLLFSAILLSLESGHDLLAGFILGIAAYKFQLVLPIACLFFFWQRWRFIWGMCLSVIIAIILSAVISGP